MSIQPDLTPAQQAQLCPTCVDALGTRRYCVNPCRCGHPACPAYATWHPLPEPIHTIPAKKARKSAWDSRDEPSWIDNL